MKILIYDVETAPTMAYVWRMWKENIAPAQVIEEGRVLCWAAKWYGSEEVLWMDSRREEDTKEMLQGLYDLISEADAIVTYNGNNFDIPVTNTQFLLNGFPPPAPSKSIDLYQTVKRRFRFNHNRMDTVCEALGLGRKEDTGGFELWARCLHPILDEEAWNAMVSYNIQDVAITEELYEVLRPWIKGHPNVATYVGEDDMVCPTCGSDALQKRGTSKTATQTYQRYQCQDCGTWSRSRLANRQAAKPMNVRDSDG